MKNLFLNLIIGLTALGSYAGNDEKSVADVLLNETSNQRIETLFMPYAENSTAEMMLVKTKGEYSLWKCPGKLVTKYPLRAITGRSYNYFVYKNGEFHLTVNEMNKDKVYLFFTNQI